MQKETGLDRRHCCAKRLNQGQKKRLHKQESWLSIIYNKSKLLRGQPNV